MIINIDTSEALSDTDKAALRALIGDATSGAVAVQATEPAAAASTKAPAAKKAAPARKAAAAKPDPEPEPEDADEADESADEADEDVLGGDEPTKAQAVALATELVGDGQAKRVKAALAQVGAKKVSELKDEHVAEFVGLLAD